jgi:DNA polymerase-3 subunit gamma/tau
MDYVVLARKLRPQRFQDLIGQETVARALRNAIQTGRVAHAFLFAGSRGVGKTSAARILTKALNCQNPQEGEPCNACPLCLEINAGSAPDVFEIDAASNRGIDNIRELRENVKYAPAKCTFKTYIIDEVHMLTQESFNALLKTLEEPPPHVKFILATTHPHRIPDTILSRCQRYDFPRIPLARMVDYLAGATAQEGLTFSRAALETVSRNSAGGMRDALTAIDQAVAFAGLAPSDADVLGLLGLMDNREVLNLLAAVLDKSLDQALDAFSLVSARGHDAHVLLEAMLREVKDLTLYRALGPRSAYFLDHLQDSLQFYEARKEQASLDELEQLFYLLLELEHQLRTSAFVRACFEMTLVKACRIQALAGVPELLARAKEMLRGGGAPAAPRPGPPARTGALAASPRAEEPRPAPPPAPPAPPSAAAARGRESAPARGEAASAAASAGPDDAEAEPPLPAPLGELPPALCEDPRFLALVKAAAGSRHLAAKLRGAEVTAIGQDTVEALFAGPPPAPEELAALEPALRAAFGPAFRLVPARDTKEAPRSEHTLMGRRQHRDAKAMEEKRQAALADPAVRELRRVFPNSKVLKVDVNAAAPGSDDVQG